MAKNWSDTPYEDAVREQTTSQTDYRALAAQLADCLQVTCQCIESLDYFGMLDKFRDIGGGDVAIRSAASNGRDALDAARKAGIL